MGTSPGKVFGREIGEAFSDSEIKLLEKTLADSTGKVRDLAIKAASSGSDADVAAMTEAVLRHDMIQGLYSQATAESGRAFRALQKSKAYWSQETVEANRVMAQQQAVTDATGRTMFQMRALAKKLAALDEPGQISKLIRDSQTPGLFDWLQSLFVNALLSGPLTHLGYTAAGEIFGLFRGVAEPGAAGGVGIVRTALGIGEPERAQIAEVGAQLYGQARGARAGVGAAWRAIRENRTVLPEEVEAQPDLLAGTGQAAGGAVGGIIPNPTIAGVKVPVGTVLESPSRLVAALHSFNWTTFYAQSISGQAFRAAVHEGLEIGSPEFANRVAELTQTPTRAMIEAATTDASNGALVTRPSYDSIMGRVSRLTNFGVSVPAITLPGGHSIPMGTLRPIKYIDPFVQIQANVLKAAFGRNTPFALFSQEVRDDLAMKNGSVAFDRTAGKILAGTSFMVAAGALAWEGLLNHSGPSDPKEAIAWRRTHGLPHGLNVGGLSFDMLRLGNIGMQMSVAADLAHAASRIGEDDASQIASSLVQAFAHNVIDESFARGPEELMKATDDPDRNGARWVRGFVTSAMPFSVGLGQVARQIDPYTRQARTLMDAAKAKIPFVSEELNPLYDVWGQPVPNRGWGGTYYEHLRDDPIDKHLVDLGAFPNMPQRKIGNVQLTDRQYADYARMSGRYARMLVEHTMSLPGFSQMQPEYQIKVLREAIEGARKQVAGGIMLQSAGTPDDINAKRRAAADAAAQGQTHKQVQELLKTH